MNEPNRNISEERQMLYYAGMALTGIGFLLFISTFFSAFSMMGNHNKPDIRSGFSNFQHQFNQQKQRIDQQADQGKSMMFRAITGMLMMIAGGICMNVGARGLAGSGVVLDPQQAREDLEPFSRMTGGMIKDALDETGIHLGAKKQDNQPDTVIKVRCQQCDALNDEDAKFCDQCGAEI